MSEACSQSPVLSAAGLGKSYAPGTFAIRDVDFSVYPGEFVAIIGRSGAGKSTMLRCLNLLTRPTEGVVRLGGVDILSASQRVVREVRGRVGMIFQSFNLVKRLTVLDNVLCGRLRFRRGLLGSTLGALRLFSAHDREVAFECLKKLQIEQLAFRRADALSGGQQQRVAIARVLAQEPEVILADEPIASLDPRSAATVMESLRAICTERRIPVIVNLHQIDIATTYATRIVGMAGGRIRFDRGPAELSESELSAIYDNEPRGLVVNTEPARQAKVPGGVVLAGGAL